MPSGVDWVAVGHFGLPRRLAASSYVEAESLHYRLRAEEDRACKRWKKGFCDKSAANCINRHDGRPSCKSARDSGWVCKLDPCPYDSHVERERE